MIEELFSTYPRQRPALPAKMAELYADEYKRNRDGVDPAQSAAQKLEQWMHLQVARTGTRRILELGAGTLNHMDYEDAAVYDIVEPFESLFKNSARLPKVNHVYSSIDEVQGEYDRIVSIAVLEHLVDLPRNIAKAATILAPGGTFQAGIPTEGGFLWGLAWRCTTGITYRLRTGCDYEKLMRHEHINTSTEIEQIVRHFFEKVTISRFPTPLFHLSFYSYIEATEPRVAIAKTYLQT